MSSRKSGGLGGCFHPLAERTRTYAHTPPLVSPEKVEACGQGRQIARRPRGFVALRCFTQYLNDFSLIFYHLILLIFVCSRGNFCYPQATPRHPRTAATFCSPLLIIVLLSGVGVCLFVTIETRFSYLFQEELILSTTENYPSRPSWLISLRLTCEHNTRRQIHVKKNIRSRPTALSPVLLYHLILIHDIIL